MFPRRLIGLASLPLTLGFATDAFAQRRPDPPPQVVYPTAVPERYQVAEQEVLARLREPPPLPCGPATCPPATVVIKHQEPVDVYYARGRRCDPPSLPCAPPVVVVDSCPPPVVYCPPPRPVYVCPPPPPRYECRPAYRSYYRSDYRSDCDSGWSFSFSIGDDCSRSSYRYRDRDCDRGYERRHHGDRRRR